jgi:succinate dehydrogenase subunit C
MATETDHLPAPRGDRREAPGGDASSGIATRVYRRAMPRNWWTRRGHYFWYVVREFTSVPLALWLLWFLVEVQRAQNGPHGYSPHSSIPFVVFSVIVLAFALYHSITFLSLAGVILHFKVLDRPVPSRLVVLAQFAAWAAASAIVAAVLIGFAR